ncbi:glyoxalase superfamily protein [Flindersiella endophytica]
MSDRSEYKLMAGRLRKDLANAGVSVSHSQSLELVAHLHGVKDWNTLAATTPVPVAKPATTQVGGAPGDDTCQVLEVVPFLHPSSMQASLAFYQDILGFRIALAWPSKDDIRWCRLELGQAAIMLQEAHGAGSPVGAGRRLGDGVSLTFVCSNALAIYNKAVAAGLPVEEPFVGNHMWVVVLHDPDGCRIEFESTTLAPEGATLSEVHGPG